MAHALLVRGRMLVFAIVTLLVAPAAASVPGSLHAPPCSGGIERWEVRGETGIVVEEGACREGRPEGRWIYRHENGVVAAEGTFSEGERDGRWVFRFHDGSVASEGLYVDGLEDGPWLERTGDGETEEGSYKLGERVGTWHVKSVDGGEASIEYANDHAVTLHASTK